EEITVGEGQKLSRYGHKNFGCGPVVRGIVARKPMIMITWLPESPRLYWTGRILWRWLDEMQSRTRMCSICHCNYKLFSIRIGTIQRHNQFVLACMIGQLRTISKRNLADIQIDRIKHNRFDLLIQC